MGEPEPSLRPRISTRDHGDLRERLTRWLASRLPTGAEPHVSELSVPPSTGMSSETLLFDAEWRADGAPHTQGCAARLAPDPDAVPVFPRYDLERQFRVMRLVSERSSVPVPTTLWYEPDERALGTPFFVMERVEGEVPPDILPYVFGSWLSEASDANLARLQRASVAILSELHGMDVAPHDLAFLERDRPGDTPLRRHFADQVAFYDWVVADGVRSPLLERGFAWLEEHWPAEEGRTVANWGDARIGNILYRDFQPVAVLDWEMAATGPREIDLAWMITLHRFFQEIAETFGVPGMPDFLDRDEVATTYEGLSGYTPRDLDFYATYAALRHGIIMFRISRRSVHFGEAEMTEDPDDLISHRPMIERMLAGTYWS